VKPQIDAARLDVRRARPHLRRMAAKDNNPKPAPNDREAKLAQALRANLRRRKAAAAPVAPKSSTESTS
jgi:hypothetical protein